MQQRLDDSHVRVLSLVGNDYGPLGGLGQHVGAFKVMCLLRRQMKASRKAPRIDRGVDLGRQAAAAAPDGLVFFRPLF